MLLFSLIIKHYGIVSPKVPPLRNPIHHLLPGQVYYLSSSGNRDLIFFKSFAAGTGLEPVGFIEIVTRDFVLCGDRSSGLRPCGTPLMWYDSLPRPGAVALVILLRKTLPQPWVEDYKKIPDQSSSPFRAI